MRIECVHIGAFGPFHDRTLELGPGLTLVYGPNEAGKSSWHAALAAGLCGVRRGAGLTNADREFAARHRPWSGGGWKVSVVVTLADGRRVEVRQDLERRVESGARDLTLGHEVTAEIINEGTPDAARWLGLDRRSFLATACVRQSDVLDVLHSAGALQEHLQRAAATGGVDETAARALEILGDFERERVGQDRANSTKPLRVARARVDRASAALDEARRRQAEFVASVGQADELEREAAARELDRRRLEAAIARQRAGSSTVAATRARTLTERYPDPVAPALELEDQRAQRAATALSAHRGLPADATPSGPTAGELRALLDALPSPPDGELDPDPGLRAAFVAWEGADRALAAHDRRRPPEVPAAPAPVPPARLREIATELESAASFAGHPGGSSREPRPWLWLALGGALAAGGLVAMLLGQPLPGALLVVAGVGLAAAMVVRERSANLRALRAEDAARRRAAAESTARDLSVPADPARLRSLATEAESAELARRAVQEWHASRDRLAGAWTEAAAALGDALAGRGVAPGADLRVACERYEAACAARRAQAFEAARRPGLEEALRQRLEVERETAARACRRREVVEELRAAAASCGVGPGDEEALAGGLDAWLARRHEELGRREGEARERGELRSLLAGGALADLEDRAKEARQHADLLAAPFRPEELDAVRPGPDADARLAELAGEARRAASAADRARGEVENRALLVPGIAAAEEELAHAGAQLAGVEDLARVIELTRGFLREAQDRVHRDIAPVLKRTLEAWLPDVTGGRYSEAIVTPDALRVRVRAANGEWRDAERLSLGTREQVYLLLRLALVEHLTRDGETCPLILDDVTVQSDATRKAAVLDLLHRFSARHQVVLFSQERDVRSWAEGRLVAPTDRLIELDARAVPA